MITIASIQSRVAAHYGLTDADMRSQCRKRVVARPRQVAMYLARRMTDKSLPFIGRRFGGRDHTTVIHAIRAVEAIAETDTTFAADVTRLRLDFLLDPWGGA